MPRLSPLRPRGSNMLTLENLKRLEPSSASALCYPTSPTTTSSCCSEEDNESLFSASLSVASSATSAAPEDDEAPFRVTDDLTGEQITVYSSLEQAVRYSMVRSEAERRQQQAGMSSWSSTLPLAAAEAVAGDEIDEDAYFSMG